MKKKNAARAEIKTTIIRLASIIEDILNKNTARIGMNFNRNSSFSKIRKEPKKNNNL